MKTLIPLVPGTFYEISGHYILPTKVIDEDQVLTLGNKLSLSCMFAIHFVLIDGDRVGFAFSSQLTTHNGGSYLMTYLRNKGPVTEHETLIKDDDLVVYNYPNKGTLAISPRVNSELITVFEEQ
jgi:hypothetical protein